MGLARTLVLAAALAATAARASGPVMVTTPRGATIAVIAEKPAGRGPFPAIVLAGGAAYDMRQPIMAGVARTLLDQGVAVYRFDWAYRVTGTPQSEARPRLWVVGDVDPLCPLPAFHRFTAAGGRGERVAVVSGDHAFRSPAHPDRNARAFDLMLRHTADFAVGLLGPAQGSQAAARRYLGVEMAAAEPEQGDEVEDQERCHMRARSAYRFPTLQAVFKLSPACGSLC